MPPLTLKTYQQSALAALTLFLRQAGTMGLEAAWAHAMARDGAGQAANKASPPYRADELGDVPCVCLRIPTGGGKTLMASHAIPLIAQTWSQRDFPVALWLVPSDTIRSQTLVALQTPGHAYRATPTARRCKTRMASAFRCASSMPYTLCLRKTLASRRSLLWRRSRAFGWPTRRGGACMR